MEGRTGRKTWRKREGQEFNNRICSHNLDLETTTQTFMLHVRPIPLCPWYPWNNAALVLRSPEISLRFLCAHASSYDCVPFCSHMFACGMHQ
jgi:hypothetical protein